MDEIAVLTDEELMTEVDRLNKERNSVFETRCDTRPWEEALCYFRREAQIRRKRKVIHETFQRQQDREIKEAKRIEDNLPSADLDNTAFMFNTHR